MKFSPSFGLLAALASAPTLTAQDVSYERNIALPNNHDYIIPLSGMVGGDDRPYALLTPSNLLGFNYETNQLEIIIGAFDGALRIGVTSIGAVGNSDSAGPQMDVLAAQPGFVYELSVIDATFTRSNMPGVFVISPSVAARDSKNIAFMGNGQLYMIDMIQPGTTTTITTAGQLVNPGSMIFGPDGLLYLLDQSSTGHNQVQVFDVSGAGVLLNTFSVSDSLALHSGLGMSPTGHLYVADGAGGGIEYDSAGNYLTTFALLGRGSPDTGKTGGAFLNIDDSGNIFVYTPGTGLNEYFDPTGITAIPEPATDAIVAGLGVLVLVTGRAMKRRRLRASPD